MRLPKCFVNLGSCFMAENKIRNGRLLSRIVSFEGLPHVGTKSPTDIDAPPIPFLLEAGSEKKYLIGDFKEKGKELPRGQQITLERHVGAFRNSGYVAIAFLAWHEPDIEVVYAKDTIVVRWFDGGWHDDHKGETLLQKYCRFFGVKKFEEFLGDDGEDKYIPDDIWQAIVEGRR